MSPRPAKDLFPDRDLRTLFGQRVRTHRLRRRMTQAELGAAAHVAGGYVGLVEQGRRIPERHFAVSADKVLDTAGELTALWPMVMRGSFPRWFRNLIELEATATAQRVYMPQVVHGPFQTEDYARTLISLDRKLGHDEAWVEEQLALRLERRDSLLARDPAQEQVVVLDEAVLRRPIGTAAIMREQLRHLIEIAEAPAVLIQILPFSAGVHMGLPGPLRILTVPKRQDLVYEESYGYGQVFDRPERVNECIVRFDLVRAKALPITASIALIQQIMEDT